MDSLGFVDCGPPLHIPILDWNSKLKEEWEQEGTRCKVSLCKKEKASLFHFLKSHILVFSLSADRLGGNFSRAEELPSLSAASFLLCLTSHSREKVKPFEEGFCQHKKMAWVYPERIGLFSHREPLVAEHIFFHPWVLVGFLGVFVVVCQQPCPLGE